MFHATITIGQDTTIASKGFHDREFLRLKMVKSRDKILSCIEPDKRSIVKFGIKETK